MTRRFQSTGASQAHIVAPDRGRVRDTGARFVRPEDEPPLWLGTFIVAAGFGLIAAAVLFVSIITEPPAVQASNSPAARIQPNSAAEAGAGKGEMRP